MKKNWLFPDSIAKAKRIQEELAARVQLQDAFQKEICSVAGLDVSNNRCDPQKMVYASAVILSYPGLVPLEIGSNAHRIAHKRYM